MFTLLLLCLMLLLGSRGQDYEEVTQAPDYDYNATFDYHLYSNTSSEALDQFLEEMEGFITSEEEEVKQEDGEVVGMEEKNGEEDEKNEPGAEETAEEVKEMTTVRTKGTGHVRNRTVSLPSSLLSPCFWILLVFFQHTL
ncbi:uncharacterized protein si:ch211-191i18.2 [Synchiropus splendidus]|uniref:uncharacterized protein si:ch211-191i18.2 n=1 Tax=Synchiropus splendidus TaxID=270530 RepID=UPI00237EA672|nr:uncharacterized protein si:ch211-191i18.2 [Synchiropus splendidus]